ncbi:MAG TPA: hypothetical protein VK327_10505 [Candidatus Paceibacterota bacterium]|nr:hypothetical protein [Candidatus Paceibacterota bacterium]
MRLQPSSPARLALLAIACVLFAFATVEAQAKDLKFEAQLIWATTSETSPDPEQKPVDEETRKTLSQLPLKWKNYFLVKKVPFTLPEGGSREVTLSEKCKISVKDIDGKNFEVALIGKGEPVLKRTQKLLKDKSLVLGGNAPDSTGWLVVLKRVE